MNAATTYTKPESDLLVFVMGSALSVGLSTREDLMDHLAVYIRARHRMAKMAGTVAARRRDFEGSARRVEAKMAQARRARRILKKMGFEGSIR